MTKEEKIKKLVNLIENENVIIVTGCYGECTDISPLYDDNDNVVGFNFTYDDNYGYEHELVEDQMTWEELFNIKFEVFTENKKRTKVEL